MRAADKLAAILNRDDTARSADKGLVNRTMARLRQAIAPLVGLGRPTCGSWADRPRYADLRFVAELVIDVAGRSDAELAIREALAFRDPYLLAWSIRAAHDADVPVDAAVISHAARDDYARSVLHDGSASLADQLPPEFVTGLARARADMTQWLAFPTELGCVPSELELLKQVDRAEGRYFVFRFRAGGGDFDDKDVFNAGVSGPWTEDGDLADRSGTFSDFKRADSATADEHLRRIVGVVEDVGD